MFPTPSFDTLLEDYVFCMANAVIDQVDADTQTRLIQFIYALDSGRPGTAACSGPTQQSGLALSDAVDSSCTPASTLQGPQTRVTILTLTQSQQAHGELLSELAQQLARVRANLAKTQAKLQERIQQNKVMIVRFEKYALAQK